VNTVMSFWFPYKGAKFIDLLGDLIYKGVPYCTQVGDSRSGARNRDSSIDQSNNIYYMFTDSLKCDQLDLQLVNQKTRGEI
jgi:hypothetical protein